MPQDKSPWFFTARRRFTPDQIQLWNSYLKFSGFTHISELVSLDSILCPELIENLIDNDWAYNVQADYRITWFTNLAYLRQRIRWHIGQDQILAILENPTHNHPIPERFEFCGFDLLDDQDNNSVLTNCGQFPSIFSPADVNNFGLLANLETANTIAANIRAEFPDEPHCRNCRVWQIARNTALLQ